MPFSFINTVASWMLKKRIHQIELFEKYPLDVQNEELKKLIQISKNTEFGKQYEFSSIDSYETFNERIPSFTYEEYFPIINKTINGNQNIFWPEKIKWFAQSSGTTNSKSKFIPVSNSSLDNCHFKGGKDMLCLYLNNNENSNMFLGKSLRLGGSRKIYENNDHYFGDLSAILIDNLPVWAELISTPNNEISLMDKWDEKIAAIIKGTLQEDVRSLAGVPSWMLTLLNKLLETTGKKYIDEIWKNLEVYFHGGVSFKPYRSEFNNIISNKKFKYYEVYNASEGFFAIQDQNESDELLLMLDYGIFYEFIEIDNTNQSEKIIDLSEVKVGVNYALLITTNSGLWRYKIGDTIVFTNLKPFRIKVSGRTKHFINTFGEEVIIENVEKSLEIALKKYNCTIKDFTVAPLYMKNGKKGKHEWMIEFIKEPNNLDEFMKEIDFQIQNNNSDYKAKRFKNITLDRPRLIKARKNLFYDWLKKKKKLGGQNKVPRLLNERSFIEELIEMN
ncbi:MAG: hypothetical protein CM15mP101_11060 [Flavobacteriaceae bacterium]|nr:MAG: hypothetical protein CM15mP101_11060 [Flavobacteriaceae bacterium]